MIILTHSCANVNKWSSMRSKKIHGEFRNFEWTVNRIKHQPKSDRKNGMVLKNFVGYVFCTQRRLGTNREAPVGDDTTVEQEKRDNVLLLTKKNRLI